VSLQRSRGALAPCVWPALVHARHQHARADAQATEYKRLARSSRRLRHLSSSTCGRPSAGSASTTARSSCGIASTLTESTTSVARSCATADQVLPRACCRQRRCGRSRGPPRAAGLWRRRSRRGSAQDGDRASGVMSGSSANPNAWTMSGSTTGRRSEGPGDPWTTAVIDFPDAALTGWGSSDMPRLDSVLAPFSRLVGAGLASPTLLLGVSMVAAMSSARDSDARSGINLRPNGRRSMRGL
jgi:hypothetical protein